MVLIWKRIQEAGYPTLWPKQSDKDIDEPEEIYCALYFWVHKRADGSAVMQLYLKSYLQTMQVCFQQNFDPQQVPFTLLWPLQKYVLPN